MEPAEIQGLRGKECQLPDALRLVDVVLPGPVNATDRQAAMLDKHRLHPIVIHT